MKLSDSVEVIHGVGPALASKLAGRGLRTIEDIIRNYPRRYDDYSEVVNLSDAKPGNITVKGAFKQVVGRYARRGMHVTEAVISDRTGSVKVVWFNQPYRANSIKPDKEYYVSGKFELSRQRLCITNPSTELVGDFQLSTARIVPSYSQVKDVSPGQMRKIIKNALTGVGVIPEILPKSAVLTNSLVTELEALHKLHFPKDQADISIAKFRLGFQEVFELILSYMVLRNQNLSSSSVAIEFDLKLAKKFVKNLPFELTPEQKVVIWKIYQEIEQTKPMNRLIEGDVGSGKTVVAAMAGAMAVAEGLQVIMLAPTEVLARQHAETLEGLLKPLGQDKKLLLLTGSMTKKQKDEAKKSIKLGRAKFIIGTHALIQESIQIDKLGLVIVDEQHRFGVEQRRVLLKKAGHMPHMLSMTATPIPRSLALTVYGDLDISVIKKKPGNRPPVVTEAVMLSDRTERYNKIKEEVQKKRQVFVVCPLIDDSSFISSRSAKQVHKELSEGIFEDFVVGLLHGQQKSDVKNKTMDDFKQGKIDVLVSTTVIEVGVDVPNATVMVIENPERFGLAQIHQLRGRVGRGQHPGSCYLMLAENKSPSRRILALTKSSDGFKLAQLDLEIRGPGAIYGRSQHGLLDLRLADLSDTGLIQKARESANSLIKIDPNLLQYPRLKKRIDKLQKIVHLN